MNLTLQREPSTPQSTPGKLYIDGVFYCYTLEDPVRERRNDDGSLIDVAAWKIPGVTAIPSGRYAVIIDQSSRFKRLMPHILDVPGFDGIRIHPGNTSADTEGCVLVGQVRNSLYDILQSKLAFNPLFTRLQATLGLNEQIFIDVEPAIVPRNPQDIA
jgi:hypothetical protein